MAVNLYNLRTFMIYGNHIFEYALALVQHRTLRDTLLFLCHASTFGPYCLDYTCVNNQLSLCASYNIRYFNIFIFISQNKALNI